MSPGLRCGDIANSSSSSSYSKLKHQFNQPPNIRNSITGEIGNNNNNSISLPLGIRRATASTIGLMMRV